MASGDTLAIFTALTNEAPPSAFATFDVRNSHAVLDFDAAIDEECVFGDLLPRNYSGLGITALLVWMASTATSGDVRWDAEFERHQDETTDLDADQFTSPQSSTATAPAINGSVQYTDIVFTNAQIAGLLAGESFRIKIRRDANNVADTMVGDAELLRVELRET